MTACLGVILDKDSNTQTFFGGGEVDNSSKQVSSTKMNHNNDIMSLKVNISGGRNIAATGQVGKNAPAFTWDTTTGEKINRIALAKNERGVAAIAISPDGSHVMTADNHNDHNITIWDMGSGDMVMRDKGGPDAIMDLAFTK
jgi:WD40 repeat protein